MTREELIKDIKEYTGNSFISIRKLMDWSGRSREYVCNLVYHLEWTGGSSSGKLYFIPDVADAIYKRQHPEEMSGMERLRCNSVNRSAYQDDIIGAAARGRKFGSRDRYSEDFRVSAAKLAGEIGLKAAAEQLGVNPNTLEGWKYKYSG